MSADDNGSLQHDEVEALSAIYGEEWCAVDKEHKLYCIRVDDGQPRPQWTINIQVHMPQNYPSDSPPEYQLNAPWLRGEEKRNLEGALADIYCENLGQSIIFLWVEKIREFLQEKISDGHDPGDETGARQVTLTSETDLGDDEFDLDLLEVTSDTSASSMDTAEVLECPEIQHGSCVTDRRSTFQPHLATVFHKSQIKQVLDKLYENKKIANATHNILAYRLVRRDTAGSSPVLQQGCDDDGETHAGSRMLHLLNILEVENVMVVVSRWYGGILLGADRFKHINNCTRDILQQCGQINRKEDKKGPKTGTEKKKR